MTNVLLDDLPYSVKIEGLEYQFKADFKTFMRFEILMEDKEIGDELKIEIALEMFYGDQFIVNESEAITRILDIYVGDTIEKSTEKVDPIYSFSEDGDLIYVSFVDAYGIDLTESKMHWWKFKALFYNLPETTIMAKVMGYRAKKITTNMQRDEIKFYKNMKKLYALKQNKTASEKEQDFADSLWG